jgi:hypothetical protein
VLAHLLVRDRADTYDFTRSGRGDPRVRPVEARTHGVSMRCQLDTALGEIDEERQAVDLDEEELRALGSIVVLEGEDPAYPLRLDSLEQLSRHRKKPKVPKWLVLSVLPAGDAEDDRERAQVWVADTYRGAFLAQFEKYVATAEGEGKPKNAELVANVGRIRRAILRDLWQSDGEPPTSGRLWWELWLRREVGATDLLRRYAADRELRVVERALALHDRVVVWVEADWQDLEALPFTSVPLAEIRRPEFVETIEDLTRPDQEELAEDLADRLRPAGESAPAVCHLDTGIRRTHVLLTGSLSEADVHSVVPGPIGDAQNHGTQMAGLALLGPLDDPLLASSTVHLRHRLESVKLLPDSEGDAHDPLAYGVVTAEAVALPEATVARQRVFCMPITKESERPGEPTLWSASVDALASGVDIDSSNNGIALLGAPDPDAARLIVISAGNVVGFDAADYLSACDLAHVEEPAQAWNALTVGAHTDLDDLPTDPAFSGWRALGEAGDLSPHSRTSVRFPRRKWPLKPDICMEGGNVLTDGADDFHESHPLLSVRTTDARDDLALSSTFATSAATAQAARLAAVARASYPAYWPETIRGLLTHGAEWTPAMRARIDSAPKKSEKLSLLRRYGWGVPTEERVLASARNAVTMVAQDEFVPFEGKDFQARHLRLHSLPWPVETLQELGAADVSMKVTLSYFIEPNAARRGWRRRYSYPSHGLRFEVRGPAETTDQFLTRVNRQARQEEEEVRPSGGTSNWLVGPYQRNVGSLHQDVWDGTGADLAQIGMLAIHPVGGWWKNSKDKSRVDLPVRYSLIVSLRTQEQGVDLYTPVRVQLELPIEAAVLAT